MRHGSHFPEECYHFETGGDNLPTFVAMLKDRGYYIGRDNHVRTPKGSLASKLMRNGYYLTSAQYDGKVHYFMEHRVVWVWHNGAIPAGLVVNHKDYNRTNNAIDNLELMTQKQNTDYSRPNQNPPVGERSGRTDTTNRQAEAIKTLGRVCGWGPKQIAALTGMKPYNVTRIVRGSRFPNVIEADTILAVYPTIVDYTRNKAIGREEEIKNYLLGLNGECGEITDLIKKVLYHGKDYDPTSLMLEMGDILYYITALGNVLGWDMSEILLNNNAKLMARYADGYSISQSLHRIEDDRDYNDKPGASGDRC